MAKPQHPRAFAVTVVWTLGLLFLGSLVHATESSLACPDWPTCFGTMVPEMTGGVFWEHLHRLVAGGLILIFLAATYLVWREEPRYRWIRPTTLVGMALLLVQAVLGGITVLFRLPDAVSTSHLGLAFLFLALAAVLAVVSGPGWVRPLEADLRLRFRLRRAAVLGALATFLQSLLGAAVRHTDAGMACPDVPLCLGLVIPPLENGLVALHFSHRLLGLLVLGVVLWIGHVAFRQWSDQKIRSLGLLAGLLVVTQVTLGFLSVHLRLAVVPVSVHTLVAAVLLTVLVWLAALTWRLESREESVGGVA
jgi:heme A synthase